MRGRSAAALLAAGAVAAVGCGAEDFPNDPRPPAPVELSARVDNAGVEMAPRAIGAGLANITISNQADDEVILLFDGPGGPDDDRETEAIPAGGVSSIRLALQEGDYLIETDVETISSGNLAVGPERESAQNELLLP